MVQNISDPRSGITLPYLQVYLDMLYRDKYRKQYGSAEPEGYPKLDITRSDISGIGKIDNVLERFLEDQTRELRVQLVQKYKTVKPNVIQNVLDVFVSEEGTKRPVAYKQSGNDIILAEDAAVTLKDIPAPMLTEILNTLQGDRILRRSDENFELAHDSIALVIDGRRSQSQKQLQNVKKRLLNAYEEFQKTGAFLNQKQLAAFDEFRPQLGLSIEMEKFLDKCEEEIVRNANEEKDRLQQETRMAQQKKLARTRGILLTMAVGLAALAAFMWFQSKTKADALGIMTGDLQKETAKTLHQNDSIANIILQVDQQLGRMESIMSGKLPQSELVKSLITLKSLVRNDTIDKTEMAKYISVMSIFTTSKLNVDPKKSSPDTVFQFTHINLVLHVKTPQPKEFIQVKLLTADGIILGEPTYTEVPSGPDGTQWTSIGVTTKKPGKYRLEIYNSQGIEIGRSMFRIAETATDEISMTEKSDFRTMASGTLKNPGREQSTFKVNQMVYYYFRINSPKSGDVISVILVDENNNNVRGWNDKYTTGRNEAEGYRGFNYHGVHKAGSYTLFLMNGDGDVLDNKKITIE